MKVKSFAPDGWVMRLDPGDDILQTLQEFYADKPGGFVWGIGSIADPKLAHYSRLTKRFTERQLDGVYEIAALHGNVSTCGGKTIVHLHVVLSDEQMQSYAGHLAAGKCSATAELLLRTTPMELKKQPDPEIGLNTLDL